MKQNFFKLLAKATVDLYNDIFGSKSTYNPKTNVVTIDNKSFKMTEEKRLEILNEAVQAFNDGESASKFFN